MGAPGEEETELFGFPCHSPSILLLSLFVEFHVHNNISYQSYFVLIFYFGFGFV